MFFCDEQGFFQILEVGCYEKISGNTSADLSLTILALYVKKSQDFLKIFWKKIYRSHALCQDSLGMSISYIKECISL